MSIRPEEGSLADDLMWGAKAIGVETGLDEKQVWHVAEHGQLPIGRVGGRLVASKKALREHFARITQGRPATAPAK